jgi:hypothetical protein
MWRATMAIVASAVGLAGLLAVPAPTSGAIISAQADVHVEEFIGYRSANFQTSPILLTRHESYFYLNQKLYMRFGTSSLTIPGDEYILGLNVVDSGRGSASATQVFEFEVYGLNDGVGENWSESGIAWSNAPANAPKNLFTSDATSLGKFFITGSGAGSRVSFSSIANPAMAAFIESDTDQQLTFMIVRNTGRSGIWSNYYSHAFASLESALGGPTLEVVQSPTIGHTPEPGSAIVWSLLATLGIGAGWWRRRKRAA